MKEVLEYIAIQKQFISPQQFLEALDAQITEEIRDGKHRLLGQILFELNHMSKEQIEEVLAELPKD